MKAVFKIVHDDHKPMAVGKFFDWYILYRRTRLGFWKYLKSGERSDVMGKLEASIKPPEYFDAGGKPI